MPWKYPQQPWLDRLLLPTKYHQWSTQSEPPKRQVIKLQKDGSCRLWPSKVSWNGLSQSRNRPGSCCSNESTYLCTHLDLGKTVLIKHKIQLTDQMPFKKHYQHIPPHMYDDMRAHIQKMLDISAICKLHSPWTSAVLLVQKKDGGLQFCIDLRKLNNWTIKDSYSLNSSTGRSKWMRRAHH